MIPVIVTGLEVSIVKRDTSDCAVKPNRSGVVSANCAEHEAVVPPFTPAHVQVQGATVETTDAAPTTQRFVVGTVAKIAPLAVPQTPFNGATGVTAFDAAESALIPTALMAVTRQVTLTPLVKPVTVIGEAVPPALWAPQLALYIAITLPPSQPLAGLESR